MWNEDLLAEDEQRKQALILHQARLENGMRQAISTDDGKYLLGWLVGQCGVFQAPYPGGHAEAAFATGKRQIGLALLELLGRIGATDFLFNNEVKNGGRD